MTKKKPVEAKQLEKISDQLFTPRNIHKKYKAKLHNKVKDNLMYNMENITDADIIKLCGSNKLNEWLAEPGFRDWLLDNNEYADRLEYLNNLALDRIEGILLGDSSDKDALNAAKLLMEASGRMAAHKQKQEFADKAIQSMSEDQLRKYLEGKGVKVSDVIEAEQLTEGNVDGDK